MSKRYDSLIPASANIEITYGKEDKVKFTYPREWTYLQAFFIRAYPTIMTFFMFAFLKLFTILLFIIIIPFMLYSYIGIFLNVYEQSDLTYTIIKVGYIINPVFLYVILSILLLILILPLIIGLNKKWVSYVMPKCGYYTSKMIGRTKQKTFLFLDIEDNKCIIPIFGNIFLNYIATGDFNKYLKKVTIMAYDFKYYVKERTVLFINRKYIANEYVYYVVFEFSKKPYTGFLECEYH